VHSRSTIKRNGCFTFQMIIDITGACDTILPFDVICMGSPDDNIICKKINKLAYNKCDQICD